MTFCSDSDFEALCTLLRRGSVPLPAALAAMMPQEPIPAAAAGLMQRAEAMSVNVADEDAWTSDPGQFRVTVAFDTPLRYSVTLPPHFSSLEKAAALRAANRPSVFDTLRFRDIVCIVLDMIKTQEVEFVRSARDAFGVIPPSLSFLVSMEDYCNDDNIFTLSRSKGYSNPLIPDSYFYHAASYRTHKLSVIQAPTAWADRSDTIAWRGSTSGSPFTVANLLANPRVRMAAVCATRPDLFDVKLTTITQVPDTEFDAIRADLGARGLLAPWVKLDGFTGYKYALHIDGNASAAGFYEKLSLGCCVLRVESAFEQWIEPRLRPWEHYVPIAADLADLVSTAEFLRARPGFAERIARAGFEFALAADFHAEAREFVRQIARPTAYLVELAAPGSSNGATADLDGWHGVEEHPDGRRFRWTRLRDIKWRLPIDIKRSGQLVVRMAVLGEIRPGFAENCSVAFAGRDHAVKVRNGVMEAEFPVHPGQSDSPLVLRTPPPLIPAELVDSTDRRALGLSIEVLVDG